MNIFIHAVNLKSGGGKANLDGIIKALAKQSVEEIKYFVLTPSKEKYLKYENKNLKIVETPPSFLILVFPIYYWFYLPSILNKYEINVVFNLGDIVIPTKIKQIYFFDWAYAVYDEDYIWNRMSLLSKTIRKTKVFLIDRNIKKYADTILAQSESIANRLNAKYGLNNIRVVNTPVEHSGHIKDYCDKENKDYNLYYPSTYGHHKNHIYLVKIAKLAKNHGYTFLINVTLSDSEWNIFQEKIKAFGVTSYFINVGRLDRSAIWYYYSRCDLVIIPSLLESYGLPFYEAMIAEKPLVTSDLDFAHAACSNAAVYFDPFDPKSGFEAVKKVKDGNINIAEMVDKGRAIVAQIPEWSDFVHLLEKEAIQLNFQGYFSLK